VSGGVQAADAGGAGARSASPNGDAVMHPVVAAAAILDEATRALVRAAAVVATGDDRAVRAALVELAASGVDPVWAEEMILQTYLFAGFPRSLNAMREWRRASGRPAPAADVDATLAAAESWTARGETTCATVYGPFYERLRHNIHVLHPALDAWMIVEGYGKVLGRPALPLAVRELCVVAVCAASRQERQLHSHLHGALHAGAEPAAVSAALATVDDLLSAEDRAHGAQLWAHVQQTQRRAARDPRGADAPALSEEAGRRHGARDARAADAALPPPAPPGAVPDPITPRV
jgi:4-carboxymuconolactone decarboxylase